MALVLAAGAGGGVYYQFVYRNRDNMSEGRVSSDSEDAVFVDSVAMLAGLGTGSGVVTRYAGVVEPEETWSAKVENEKSVAKTYVKEGDVVKVGDVLFTYDTSDDQEKLEQSKIDMERRENENATTKVALEKARKEEAKASQEEKLDYNATILEYELTIKTNENENKAAERENEQLEEAIRSADVVSELDGIVKSITEPGSSSMYDSSNSENYITIMSVGSYRVKALINEQHINDITEGDPMLAFSRVDGTCWPGTIVNINTEKGETSQQDAYMSDDSSDNGSSTNYPFYVELEDSTGLILGQHVYLEPDVGQDKAKEGIWLPDYYFEDAANGTAFVWAASARNVLEHRKVKIGEHDDEMLTYEVLEGLDEDDYITAPTDELEEGLPVSYIDYSNAGTEDVYGDESFDDGSFDDFDDGSYFLYYDEGSMDDSYWDDEEEAWDEGSWDDEDWDDEDWEEDAWEDEEPGEVTDVSGDDAAREARKNAARDSLSAAFKKSGSSDDAADAAAAGSDSAGSSGAGSDGSDELIGDTGDDEPEVGAGVNLPLQEDDEAGWAVDLENSGL